MDRESAAKATLDTVCIIAVAALIGVWIWMSKTQTWMPAVNVFLFVALVVGGIWTIQYNEHNYKGDGEYER